MYHVGALVPSCQTSPICIRDKVYLEKNQIGEFYNAIPDDSPLYEMVILCTCNRIEYYFTCTDHSVTVPWLLHFLASYHKISIAELEQIATSFRCTDAVEHLFRVACGIESMVFGEYEILGQIRSAYFTCYEYKTTKSYLNRLFQQAIATGKKVRSNTSIGLGSLSIATIAIKRMQEYSGDLQNKSIMVVGTGTMGFRALKLLQNIKTAKVGVSNRTDSRSLAICTHFKTEHIPFNQMKSKLNDYDIIILATSSEQFILTPSDIVNQRNVCVDDLRTTADISINKRNSELHKVEDIIEAQVTEFKRWYTHKNGEPCLGK